jgi:hypothetical protein
LVVHVVHHLLLLLLLLLKHLVGKDLLIVDHLLLIEHLLDIVLILLPSNQVVVQRAVDRRGIWSSVPELRAWADGGSGMT